MNAKQRRVARRAMIRGVDAFVQSAPRLASAAEDAARGMRDMAAALAAAGDAFAPLIRRAPRG